MSPEIIDRWAGHARSLASSIGLYAPALLGLTTLVVMVTWLMVLRHLEPPRQVLDQTAVGVLRLWLVLAIVTGVTMLMLRTTSGLLGRSRPHRIVWRRWPIQAAFVWAPALLWLYFIVGALLVLNLQPVPDGSAITREHRAQLHLALAIWLATSVAVAIARAWQRRRQVTSASTATGEAT